MGDVACGHNPAGKPMTRLDQCENGRWPRRVFDDMKIIQAGILKILDGSAPAESKRRRICGHDEIAISAICLARGHQSPF
jgi:hypothetical protein